MVDGVRSEILWNISEKVFFEQFRVNLCAAGQDSVCPTWPDCFVRGVKSSWLAAIRHSDDGNYIAEVPQTSVNPCPLYQDCLRLYVSQRWISQ